MVDQPITVAVYAGSCLGANPRYRTAAEELGRLIGERGWRLVYGAGGKGLMGVVAHACLEAGGEVIGVTIEDLHLMQQEGIEAGLTDVQFEPTLYARKEKMADLADMFVVLPGGLGSLDELFDVWTQRKIELHGKPIGLLNVAGYYDLLLAFLAHMLQEEFMNSAQHGYAEVGTEPGALLDTLFAKIPG